MPCRSHFPIFTFTFSGNEVKESVLICALIHFPHRSKKTQDLPPASWRCMQWQNPSSTDEGNDSPVGCLLSEPSLFEVSGPYYPGAGRRGAHRWEVDSNGAAQGQLFLFWLEQSYTCFERAQEHV